MKTYDLDKLRKLIHYDPETGLLTWKERTAEDFNGNETAAKRFNTWRAGEPAGGRTNTHPELVNGYWKIKVQLPYGPYLPAHRIAWALYYGEWPTETIDHINGDCEDNRMVNLRQVSHAENQRNKKRPVNNKSGRIGVCKPSNRNKWWAYINYNRKSIHLGEFDTKEEAIAAREKAEMEYGFHENHGRETVNAEG